jgi:hypothetical protein
MWQLDVVLHQVLKHTVDRAAARKLLEDQCHDGLRLLVWVLDDLS